MACIERKESGRTYYTRADYSSLIPSMNKPLVMWLEGGQQKLSWGG
jgi:hypothetical protein